MQSALEEMRAIGDECGHAADAARRTELDLQHSAAHRRWSECFDRFCAAFDEVGAAVAQASALKRQGGANGPAPAKRKRR